VTTPADATASIDSLDAVIAAYLQDVEAGRVPNRQDLLQRHPELADALRAFFADFDRMDRVASPLRLAGGLRDDTGTVGLGAESPTGLPAVRYFGDYELLEEIARGGMGVVYKGRQVSLNRLVALKMVLAGTFASPREVQRFRAEAEAAANLDHPHIVAIYEVGEHEGQQYYSMKFVEGTSLAKQPRGPARVEVAGVVAAARAVHHAHQHGVLHRDLKPSNVLVDPQGMHFVTDFGLAKRLAGMDRSLTEPGQILGTPRYMAPEQAAGRKDLTVAADVYSLGVILYERLTGRTPFAGDDVLTLLRQARESEPPRPSSIHPGLDRDLETVVLKCLEKDPARRYPSAEALADDLDRWLAGKPITARPSGSLARAWKWARRNPAVATLAAAVGVLLVALLIGSIAAAVRLAAAARSSQGLYLAAQSELVRPSNPGLALVLALEGAERHPGPMAHNAVLAAMEANEELRTLLGHQGKVTTVAVAPDGRTAVTGSEDRTARLWDLDSGRARATFEHDAPVIAARFTPDGRQVVTFSGEFGDFHPATPTAWTDRPMSGATPTVRVWDAATGRRLAQWAEPEGEPAAGWSNRRLHWRLNRAGVLDISPDGRRVAVTTGGYPGNPPRIIDLESGAVRAELNGHDGPVASIAFSPDGRRVATAAADQTARIWDVETGSTLRRLAGHTCDVWFVAFSPDGRRLLTLGEGHQTRFTVTSSRVESSDVTDMRTREKVAGRIWDVETGVELVSLKWPKREHARGESDEYGFADVARFGPDGRTILTAGLTGASRGGLDTFHPGIWDAGRGQLITSLRREEPDPSWPVAVGIAATEAAISADGQRLAIAYQDGLVRLLSPSGTLVKVLHGHTRATVHALAFTPDGRRLVSASDDGTARVWDARIGEEADFARGRWPEVEHAVYSPDGRLVAAVVPWTSRNGLMIALRDAASGRELARIDGPGQLFPPPVFSPDGRTLLVHTMGSSPILYDTASGRQLKTIGPATRAPALAFSPDGRAVAIAEGDGHLVEVATGREQARLEGLQVHPIHGIRNLHFSPDGTKVVSLSSGPGFWTSMTDDIAACLWDARDGRRLAILKDSEPKVIGPVTGADFSPDGRHLATASSDFTPRIWDVATGRKRVILRGHGRRVNSVAYSPKGGRLVTSSDDGTARLWDDASGRELARLEGHEGPVRSARFSPDGTVVLTHGDDRTVRLWDGGDGRPLCTLVRHDVGGIDAASFSPDGRVVVVSFSGQSALTRTWPLDFLSAARARCPRALTLAERARFELPPR
jgi:WD40 repeat protein/predicted Ser/Thr protein kinase